LETLRTQMETNAQNGEYGQALKTQEELKTKVENILAAPKDAGGTGPDGKPIGGAESEGPRVLEKLDRDSDSSPKGGGAPPAPAENLIGFPGGGPSDAGA